MSRLIHWESPKALRLFRKNPASLAVYWCYVSRMNNEAIAYPSIRGIARETGWNTKTVHKARQYLIEIGALTPVDKGVRADLAKKYTGPELQRRVNLDRSEFYRVNDTFTVAGETYCMLFNGAQQRAAIDEPEQADVPSGTTWAASNMDEVPQNVVPGGSNVVQETMPEADAPAERPVEKAKRKRPQRPIFDAIARDVFQLEPDAIGDAGGRIGKIEKWLKATHPDTTPDDLGRFIQWYIRNTHSARPRDLQKFAERFAEWKTRTTRYLPATDPKTPADLDILLQEVG